MAASLKEDEQTHARGGTRIKFDDWIQTIDDPQLEFRQRIEVGATSMQRSWTWPKRREGRPDRSGPQKTHRSWKRFTWATHVLDILRRSSTPVLMSKYMVQYEWQGEKFTVRTNEEIWKRPLLASDWSAPFPARPRRNPRH
jgi:hypothetical protein